MDFDPVSQKEDSVQYVSIESILREIFSLEDVLAHILKQVKTIMVYISHLGMLQIKRIYF